MTTDQRFERDLPDLLADLYLGSTPDYRDDVLARTSRMRQRPTWTFPERWLPMSVITLARNTLKPIPWRTIAVLALLAVLLAVAIAAFVASPRHLPPPFGRAVNGLVAYAKGGDIYIVDPATGARRVLVAGPENDHDPRFSLDGTRLAFLRGTADQDQLVIVDAGGQNPLIASGPPLLEGGMAWSPDGHLLAVTSRVAGAMAITIVDTRTGVSRLLDVGMPADGVSWRPPSGSELLFSGGTEPDLALYLIKPDGSDRPRQIVAHDVPLNAAGMTSPAVAGWSPDGAQLTFHRGMPDGTIRTYVRDIASGTELERQLVYGRVSNDGKRIASLSEDTTWVCVADLAGGPCTKISEVFDQPAWGTDFAWSPDDRWIYTTRSDGAVFILDPEGGPQAQPSWLGESTHTWQRTAP
jgi:Tol biopolymer transport system component